MRSMASICSCAAATASLDALNWSCSTATVLPSCCNSCIRCMDFLNSPNGSRAILISSSFLICVMISLTSSAGRSLNDCFKVFSLSYIKSMAFPLIFSKSPNMAEYISVFWKSFHRCLCNFWRDSLRTPSIMVFACSPSNFSWISAICLSSDILILTASDWLFNRYLT